MDSRKNKAIETWAMLRCRQENERLGFTMEDTSKTRPFDFLAEQNGGERRVEVKGSSGDLGKIMLTIGEVSSAQDLAIYTDLWWFMGSNWLRYPQVPLRVAAEHSIGSSAGNSTSGD
jgi:hypothetical protein